MTANKIVKVIMIGRSSGEGKIVFTGEWENDQYLDGVLYQKVAQDDNKEPEIDF